MGPGDRLGTRLSAESGGTTIRIVRVVEHFCHIRVSLIPRTMSVARESQRQPGQLGNGKVTLRRHNISSSLENIDDGVVFGAKVRSSQAKCNVEVVPERGV